MPRNIDCNTKKQLGQFLLSGSPNFALLSECHAKILVEAVETSDVAASPVSGNAVSKCVKSIYEFL